LKHSVETRIHFAADNTTYMSIFV